MTKNELIDLADRCNENSKNPIEFIEKFADAVASAEREACAKLRDTLHPFDLHNRSEMLGVMNQGLDDYQNLIRARGQA